MSLLRCSVLNRIELERVTADGDLWLVLDVAKWEKREMDSNSWAFPSNYPLGLQDQQRKCGEIIAVCYSLGCVCWRVQEGASPSVGVGLTLVQVQSVASESRCLEALPSVLWVCLLAVALAAAASSLLTPSCLLHLISFALSQKWNQIENVLFSRNSGEQLRTFSSHTLTAL